MVVRRSPDLLEDAKTSTCKYFLHDQSAFPERGPKNFCLVHDKPGCYHSGRQMEERRVGRDEFPIWLLTTNPVLVILESDATIVKLLPRTNFASLVREGEEQSLGCALKWTGKSDHFLYRFSTKSPIFSPLHLSLPSKVSYASNS